MRAWPAGLMELQPSCSDFLNLKAKFATWGSLVDSKLNLWTPDNNQGNKNNPTLVILCIYLYRDEFNLSSHFQHLENLEIVAGEINYFIAIKSNTLKIKITVQCQAKVQCHCSTLKQLCVIKYGKLKFPLLFQDLSVIFASHCWIFILTPHDDARARSTDWRRLWDAVKSSKKRDFLWQILLSKNTYRVFCVKHLQLNRIMFPKL